MAADEGPCGFYRIIGPSSVLSAQGADITIERRQNNLLVRRSAKTGRVVDIDERHFDYDVVIFQRPFERTKAEAIEILQSKGVAVVVELDDHVGAIHPRNIAYWASHPTRNPDSNYKHVSAACRAADLVVVTTPALARTYASHGRVAVIPNAIQDSWLSIKAAPDPHHVVGWPGTVATHPEDLQSTKGGVAAAVEASDWRFRVVGDGHLVATHLRLSTTLLEATGTMDFDQYPHEIARLDLGVVPLEHSIFNEAKSWLKGLEMAALGVPFVASATAEYKRLARGGAGIVVDRPREWTRTLTRLMESADERAELAGRGREVAAQNTIEKRAHLWIEAWEQAVVNRRERLSA